ncbi:MAG: allophanate hydrolase, partial [Gemmatimonas sp.]
MDAIELLQTPPLWAVRGLPQHGRAHLGLCDGGVMDGWDLQQANALLGNAPGAAALELVAGPLRLRASRDLLVMQAGARFELRIDGRLQPERLVRRVPQGAELRLDGPLAGQYGLLAVDGGITSQEGFALRLGAARPVRPRGLHAAVPSLPLALLPGPEFALLDAPSRAALWRAGWVLEPGSNRIGLRLKGPMLDCAAPELLSHAVQPGLVQLPPGGQPIVLGAGAAASGGYPRIGQVAACDLWKLAHFRPGSVLRFAPIDLDSARA